ncbi:MAG TPA: LPS export ABC transporter periplasmic protein LptC [Candidatus Aquilonibacter sp.]|nr:LPS export ABC transporter periplasmic protein LptC [Candidatus Aquilonibacter sp.]
MRNREAARYARWSAMAAGAIALVVFGFYAERTLRGYFASRHGPTLVPEAVQQQSAGVSYSFSNQNGTTFTIRASHATEFKQGDQALLQDVWVTIYGKRGDRNDNIHTRECSYQPAAGNVQCSGEVEIDMQGVGAAPGAAAQPLHVTTSDVTFNKETGAASTPAQVDLTFAGGQGHGVGLVYSSQKATITLQKDVYFEMAASQRTGGLPVNASASSMVLHRDDRTIQLGGPVAMKQGERQLNAQQVSVVLDKQGRAQEIAAEGSPSLSGDENGANFMVTAAKFDGTLDPSGAVQQVTADGGVNGMRKSANGEDRFSAERVEFAMAPGRNLVQQMTAMGDVTGESSRGGNARALKTSGLQINFAVPPAGAKGTSAGVDKQQIESAETLGPATIETRSAEGTIDLKAAKFDAQFGANGRLAKLLGYSGVEIARKTGSGEPETSSAEELAATFGADGDWASVDETGNVRLAQDGEVATAKHARFAREPDTLALDGAPVFSDGMSRTSAAAVVINQKTGEIQATGGVISTELAQATGRHTNSRQGAAASGMLGALGEGDAHIAGETLTGSMTSGDVTFKGHARVWQGQAVLDADQIEVSQDEGKLIAMGHVIAAFAQAPGEGPQLPSMGAKTNAGKSAAETTVWNVEAEQLAYSNKESIARLSGGVKAWSEQGSLQSRTLDVYLAPGASNTGKAMELNPAAAFGAGGLERVVAQGDVIVSQNGIHGYAEQAEYDAAKERFTLTGGEPRITDGEGNTTTGHSLTYDVASDTISVDSAEGSRTLTRHRVEK